MGPESTDEYTAFYASNSQDNLNELMAKWANAGWTVHSATPIPGSVLMIWQRRRQAQIKLSDDDPTSGP
jgi:hypothetical protein